MRSRLFLLLLPVLAFGQATQNSITVTASRNSNLQPDQVVLEADVTGPISLTRDQAIGALDGTGITTANSTGVRTTQVYSAPQNQAQTQLVWSFTLTADLASLKDTIGMLSAAQQRLAAKDNGLSMSFYVQGTQVSARLAQSQQCVLSDLIADARAQGQKIANAAGMSLGSILSVSSATSTTAAGFGSIISTPVCTLTVRFSLGAF
jgi:uncharacterized protein YggE